MNHPQQPGKGCDVREREPQGESGALTLPRRKRKLEFSSALITNEKKWERIPKLDLLSSLASSLGPLHKGHNQCCRFYF